MDNLTEPAHSVRRIPLQLINDSLIKLRSSYSEEKLDELSSSVKKHGQLQAVIVQPAANSRRFDLIIGSRRFRAAKKRGARSIEGYVVEKRTPVDALLMALAENLHRDDLDPFEEARAFLKLMNEHGMDQTAIAEAVNKKADYVTRRIQLISLPEPVKELVAEKKLGLGYVPRLARVSTADEQLRFAKKAIKHRLTPRELGSEIARARQERPVSMRGHTLTPAKVNAFLRENLKWLSKIPRRLRLKQLTAAEKTEMVRNLSELEQLAGELCSRITEGTLTHIIPVATNTPEARNHYSEWASRDIQRITAATRPSDEELSLELGRTVVAIRAMRAKIAQKKNK